MNSNTKNERLLATALALWRESEEESWISVTGGSMSPLFCLGDRLLVRHNINGIRPGKIVVFQRGDELIAHRLVQMPRRAGTQMYLTKGDNQMAFDPLVTQLELLGYVVALERDKKQRRLDTPIWIYLGRWIALFSFVVSRSVNRLLALRKEKQSLNWGIGRILLRITYVFRVLIFRLLRLF